MIIKMIYLAIICWYICGCASFIFWWTKEYDFTAEEIIYCFVAGFLGIISFLINGLCYYSFNNKPIIRRGKNGIKRLSK